MLAIRLPAELERRLDALAKRTGRSKSYYARAAIVEYLSTLEGNRIAEPGGRLHHPVVAQARARRSSAATHSRPASG